jgi:hypothetical protein
MEVWKLETHTHYKESAGEKSRIKPLEWPGGSPEKFECEQGSSFTTTFAHTVAAYI